MPRSRHTSRSIARLSVRIALESPVAKLHVLGAARRTGNTVVSRIDSIARGRVLIAIHAAATICSGPGRAASSHISPNFQGVGPARRITWRFEILRAGSAFVLVSEAIMEQENESPDSRRIYRVSWVCDHIPRDGKESVHMAGTLAAKLVRHTRRGPPGQYSQARVYREDSADTTGWCQSSSGDDRTT